MRTLNRAEHRVVSVTLLVAFMAAIYTTIIAPLFVDPATLVTDQMHDLQDTAARYHTLLDQRPALQKASIRLAEANRLDPVTLTGNDAAQVSADLVDHLGSLVQAHQEEGAGCDVEDKTPIVDPQSHTAFPEVKVNLSLACSIEPLAQVLSDIEHAKPYLFIESMSVARSDDAPAKGPAGKLHVQLTVAAYMHPVEPAHVRVNAPVNASTKSSQALASGAGGSAAIVDPTDPKDDTEVDHESN